MNRDYAKPKDDMTPEYGPDTLAINERKIYSPKAVHYRIAGYLPLRDVSPSEPAPDGKHWERTGLIEAGDGCYKWTYRLVDDPPPPAPPPRRWSRLSIKTALAQSGMLAAAKEFFGATEIAPGYTALEALTDCDYIEEGYPDATQWEDILNGAASALSKTREEIDAFLDLIPTEVA